MQSVHFVLLTVALWRYLMLLLIGCILILTWLLIHLVVDGVVLLHELCLRVVRSVKQWLLLVIVRASSVNAFFIPNVFFCGFTSTKADAAANTHADTAKDRETNSKSNACNFALFHCSTSHVNGATARAIACIVDPTPSLSIDYCTLLRASWVHSPRHSKV